MNDGKQRWRGLMRDAFFLLQRAARRRLDAALAARALRYLAPLTGGSLLGFAPLDDEPDVLSVFAAWLAGGGTAAFPRWVGENGMRLFRVAGVAGDLVPGRAGIREPKAGSEEIRIDDVDAALIPGRAFSEGLKRLGRGAGCYDALLASARVVKIGVAYDFQVFPDLPAGAGDVSMDAVLTPGRTIPGGGGRDLMEIS